jgi:D-alanyl-D-alanine carboxypeptidase/D-alanyl-D-alanine-endopeptidase (penicillin-binding protein 4)
MLAATAAMAGARLVRPGLVPATVTDGLEAPAPPRAAPALARVSPSLRDSLDRWAAEARALPGRWGVAVSTLDGTLVWALDADSALAPASTAKLFTTGFARAARGGDARIPTRVLGAGTLAADGTWRGPWALELNGDPTLDARAPGAPSLDALAARLAARGVRRLAGPLALVTAAGDTATGYPAAWSRRYEGSAYAAPVGPFVLHENVVHLEVRPAGAPGRAPVILGTRPAGVAALVANEARTVEGGGRLRLVRRGAGWALQGGIGVAARPATLVVVAHAPAAVAEAAWAAALAGAGIAWDRGAAAPVVSTSMETLAEVRSAPLDSLALDVNTRSFNLGAEALARFADPAGGAAALEAHVRRVAGPAAVIRAADGSGLSGENRVSAATQARYLASMAREAPAFPALLPANGQGTLRRMRHPIAPGVLRAKSGTIDHVTSLAGYVGRDDGLLAVSAIYNGRRTADARDAEHRLFALLAAGGRPVTPR